MLASSVLALVLPLAPLASSQPAGPASQPATENLPGSMPAAASQPAAPQAPTQPAAPAAEPAAEEPASATKEDWIERVFGPDEVAPPTVGALTSRPGFSENAATLPAGGMLLTGSVNVESDIDAGLVLSANALDLPDVMLRVGVFDYLELRVGGAWRLNALA